MKWKSDADKLAWIREKLYTPVVSDTLDGLGLRQQAMRHDIRPLHPDFVVVGRARTLLWMATYEPVKPNPYVNEIKAIDSLRPGDVAVHSTDHSWTVAPWGELLSTAAKTCAATLVMALVVGGMLCWIEPGTSKLEQLIRVSAVVAAAGASFLLAAFALRSEELHVLAGARRTLGE